MSTCQSSSDPALCWRSTARPASHPASSYRTVPSAATAEEELARLLIGRCYVTVNRLTGLLSHLEFGRLASLLAYGRTIDSVTMRSNVRHPQADDVASSNLDVDR